VRIVVPHPRETECRKDFRWNTAGYAVNFRTVRRVPVQCFTVNATVKVGHSQYRSHLCVVEDAPVTLSGKGERNGPPAVKSGPR
jgi:hypothetical protein